MSNKLIIDIEKIQGKYDYHIANAAKLRQEAEKSAAEAEKLKILLDSLDLLKECSEDDTEKKYSFQEYLKTTNSTKKITKKISKKSKTKGVVGQLSNTAQAIEVCLEMLRNGEEVHTANQFYQRISQKGIQISKASVTNALSKSNKMKYDYNNKLWQLHE